MTETLPGQFDGKVGDTGWWVINGSHAALIIIKTINGDILGYESEDGKAFGFVHRTRTFTTRADALNMILAVHDTAAQDAQHAARGIAHVWANRLLDQGE